MKLKYCKKIHKNRENLSETNFYKKILFEKGFYFDNKIAIALQIYKFLSVNVTCYSIGRDVYTDTAAYRRTESIGH